MKKHESRTNQVKVDTKSRRMFLKSTAGYTLSLPFLPSLLTLASEKAMAAAQTPLRYVQLFTPMGGLYGANWVGPQSAVNPFQLYPGHTAHMSSLASLDTATGISPIFDAKFKNLLPYMNLILGLDTSVYWGHNRGAGTGVFCINRSGYRNLSDQMQMNGKIDIEYPSIDQVIGYAGTNGIYGSSISGRRRHFHFGESSAWGRDDFFERSSPVTSRDAVTSTAGAFAQLFGSVAQSEAQGSTNPLLNLVNEFWPSGKSLFRFLSNEDRQSLDNLFQLAQQAANDYSGSVPVCTDTTKPAGTATRWVDDGSSLRGLAEIITMAFKCDVTRVVTVAVGDSLGLPWHPLSHSEGTNPQDGLLTIHKNIADNFYGYLGDRLRLTPEPTVSGANLLDNSLLYWTQENRVAHDTHSLPTVLLGRAGDRINTGNLIDLRNRAIPGSKDGSGFEVHPGEIINRLWSAIFYAMNIPRSSYELARGGGSDSTSLTKGYGHVLLNKSGWFSQTVHNVSQIGEPWDFIKKSGTFWAP